MKKTTQQLARRPMVIEADGPMTGGSMVVMGNMGLQSSPVLLVSSLMQSVTVAPGAEVLPSSDAGREFRPCCGGRHATAFCPQCGNKLVSDVSPGVSLLRSLKSAASSAEESIRKFFNERAMQDNRTPLTDREFAQVERAKRSAKDNEAWADWVQKALAREAKG